MIIKRNKVCECKVILFYVHVISCYDFENYVQKYKSSYGNKVLFYI